jgi:serine/threonine protein kinase
MYVFILYPVHKVTVVGLHGKLDNLEHLKKLIYDEAEEYEIGGEKVMGRSIPSSYHELDSALAQIQKEVVAGRRSPIMHTPEFKDVIRNLNLSDITSDEELKTATLFLHEVGSLLHYDDRKNNLDDLYFVDPRWLCDMMSTVVTIEQRNPFVKNGIIQRTSLPLLYKGDQFPTEFLEQYLVLLDRFEVALPLDQDKSLILIPSMLQDVRPKDIEPPADYVCYERAIHFDVPTPPGFWSRLIVRAIHSLDCIQELTARNSAHEVDTSSPPPPPPPPSDLSHTGSDRTTSTTIESEQSVSVEASETEKTVSYSSSSSPTPNVQISLPQVDAQAAHSMIQIGDVTLKYWKTGICYQSPDLYFSTEDLCNLEKGNGVWLTASLNEVGCKVYGQLIDLVNSLVADWYHGLLESKNMEQGLVHRITCTSCLERGVPDPKIFERSELVRYITENSSTLYCPKDHEVALVDIVPDLVLADLDKNFFLTEEDVQFTKGEKDQLGAGGFGTVFRGHCRQQSVAVKIFNADSKGEPLDALKELRVEAKVLQKSHHPCLVNMVGVVIFPKPALVMEEAPMGSLSGPLLKDTAPISRTVLFRMAAQIASALNFLHSVGYIYRDLKAANVLLWSLGLDHFINCKLADFGIVASAAPIGVKGTRGTVGFIAPEVAYVGANHSRATYDFKADVFSYAMVLYQMVTRQHPFADIKQIQVSSHIEAGRRPRMDYPLVTIGLYTMSQMMKRCWKQNPSYRPKMDTIIEHMTSPQVQLMMAVYNVKSEYSLRTACCSVMKPLPNAHNISLSSATHQDQASNELWISCHSEKGADINVYEMNNMAHLKTHKISDRQVQCMAVCGEHVWIASRRGLESGVIDICSIKTRNAIHCIRMRDTSVSCISSSSSFVYIGTMEGYVFMYKVGVDAIRSKEKPFRRYLSEDCVNGVAITNSFVWVSSTNQILICNPSTLEKVSTITLPGDVPGYVGELAVNESKSIVWSAHIGGRAVCAWDLQHQCVKFSISLKKVLAEISPQSTEDAQIVTAMCCALDTVWCGTGTGHIVIFSSHGDLLLHFHVYREYVRFLIPINNSGPCNSEECMVLSGGKKYLKNSYLEGVSEDAMVSDEQADKAKIPNQGAQEVAGTVVLWEALRSCYLRQMKIMSSGDTWQSYDIVKHHEQKWEDSKTLSSSAGSTVVVVAESKEKSKEEQPLRTRVRTKTFLSENIQVKLPAGTVETVKCPKPVLLKKLMSIIKSSNLVEHDSTVISLSYSTDSSSTVTISNQSHMDEYISMKNRPTLNLQVVE